MRYHILSIFLFSVVTLAAQPFPQQGFYKDTLHANPLPGWPKENVVNYHWRAEPDNLHPTNGKSNPRRVILDFTQRFLCNIDYANLQLRPDLVKRLPEVSPDGLRYTFELRDSVYWDNGDPLTVDDVLFSFKAAICPHTDNGAMKSYFENLVRITVDPTSSRKFTLEMSKKYIQNVAFTTDIVIMQEAVFDKQRVLAKYSIEDLKSPNYYLKKHADIEAWAKIMNNPLLGRDPRVLQGLGAYRVVRWEERNVIELKRKSNAPPSVSGSIYEAANPERIVFRIISDEQVIRQELKKQQIDVSAWMNTAALVDLQQDSAFRSDYLALFMPNYDYQYIGMNMQPDSSGRQPFFKDKNVRRAMALLTPVDEIIKQHVYGKAIRQASYLSPLKTGYDVSLKLPAFDVAQAKKLLDAAGWKDTDGDKIRDKKINGKKIAFECELLIMTGNPFTEKIARDIAAAYLEAGIKLNYRAMEFSAFYEKVQAHEFDMYLGAWSGSFFPDDPQQLWHSSNWANKGSNYVGFKNKEADALIELIRTTIDDKQRMVYEKKLQQLIYNEQPYIFMYSPMRKIAVHRRFENVFLTYDKPGVLLNMLQLRK